MGDQLAEREDLVSLENGCVCCSLRKDIVKVRVGPLRGLKQRRERGVGTVAPQREGTQRSQCMQPQRGAYAPFVCLEVRLAVRLAFSRCHQALAELLRRGTAKNRQADTILLETTGLADPSPVAFTFFANPWVAARFRLDSIT